MKNVEVYKQKLLNLRNEVTQRMETIERDIRHEDLSADWNEQATERENDEVLETLGNAAERELHNINAALQRIENGTYFYCQECGDEIPPARLELLPFSTLCVSCAEDFEYLSTIPNSELRKSSIE